MQRDNILEETPRQEILSLDKNGNHYVFVYAVGREHELLESFVDLANNPKYNFDFGDASDLSCQMGQQLSEDLTGKKTKR